ncbi:Lrp/AsnC ligand binding domain-containing protein [Chitinimonas sp. BJYL2]|uniref:Lrp/AsnC ligand binding domain-containing protein n=1 Tax=Chitinimonas sp. BJYL2 TaxID=2976696 RepID=UPI0022B2DFE3|nr:Lrp/AsnC ligand binding domain-containing protein [Chitinimonas sp. BJYL2]
MTSEIDRIDRKILRELQDDGRIANVDLARKIGLSPTACLERVKRLTRDGYILGYGARLNPELLDAGLLVFVEVLLDRTTPEVFERFRVAVMDRPEVQECHLVAGGFDYLIKARVRDMKAYRDFLAGTLLGLPGVRETHTYAVMDAVKESGAIPIAP